MKTQAEPLFKAVCVCAVTWAITACGGGSNEPAPPPPPELNINSNNFEAVAGTAVAGVEQSAKYSAVGAISQNPSFSQPTPGEIACPKGGSLQLSLAEKKRIFTAVNCQTEQFAMVSGSLTEAPGDPNSAYDRTFELKDMNIRDAAGDIGVASINGMFYTNKKELNLSYVFAGDITVTRSGRSDAYAITVKADGNTLLVLNTPRLKERLVINTDIKAKALVIKSRGDGSWLTLKESADGKGTLLELRGPGNDAVIQSKTLSASELAALVAQSR